MGIKIENLIVDTKFLKGMYYTRPTKANYSETEDIDYFKKLLEI